MNELAARTRNVYMYICELINLERTFNRETIDSFYHVLSLASCCVALRCEMIFSLKDGKSKCMCLTNIHLEDTFIYAKKYLTSGKE